ncbi:hypothetical protein [Rubrivivax rivuli]|uniref:Uncharacterized protein n=1 Tax=Rubrivivax rivuli TaxID=1862385 RepID=A0A437RH67_9BURK|nr:hypothetical protein [Rubrivivax rivuli]RVU46110.1 hypothetical protein EOE66_09590 [Rubrivivax rivuli]
MSAAPTTEVPTTNASAPAAPTSVLEGGVRKHSGRGETSTIDMLVEMQQPSAGLQFNERQRPGDGRVRPTPPAGGLTQGLPAPGNSLGNTPARAEPPPVSAAGLFGAGATPQVQQQQMARPAAPVAGLAAESGGPSPRSAPSEAHANPALARWLALPREVIQYVRENRGLVIGSAVALLLSAWMGSVLVARLRG